MIKRFFLQAFLSFLATILAAGFFLYFIYQNILTAPLIPDKNSIISIKRGENINIIAQELYNRHIIKSKLAMIVYARINGLAEKIKVGDYKIYNGKLSQLLQDMVNGRVITHNITIVEGKTFKDLLKILSENNYLKHTLNGKSPEEISALLKINNQNPEGLFLPETYQIHNNTTDLDLLLRMKKYMNEYLNQEWSKRDNNLPLKTPYEALILASIIEKETGLPSERGKVSGVFNRRLKKNMFLQTDPSVIYGIKDYQGYLTKNDLKIDTPYNTYIHKGLPPTPISLPSKASINAALHPDKSDALYFVATGHGGHTFSSTYEEHKKAVEAYRQWQKSQNP